MKLCILCLPACLCITLLCFAFLSVAEHTVILQHNIFALTELITSLMSWYCKGFLYYCFSCLVIIVQFSSCGLVNLTLKSL